MKALFGIIFVVICYGFEFNYTTLTADFNQTVTNSDNKTIKYTGSIKTKIPELMVWEYKTPIPKTIWINFNKIEIYEPNLIQTTIYQNSNKDNFFKMLKDAKKIDKNTYFKHFNNKDIYFKVKNSLLTKIYYKDKIDNLVTIDLYNQVVNKKIKKSSFIPKYPDYTDIIYAK